MCERTPDGMTLGPNGESSLGHALRALPSIAPSPSAWAAVAQGIAARRKPALATRTLRFGLPLALAAGLAVFLLRAPTPVPEIAAPIESNQLATLRAQSETLEQWLEASRQSTQPIDGSTLLAVTEMEDLIGLVDLQLAAPTDDAATRLNLWRQRVALMSDLLALQSGGEGRVALAQAGGASATPAMLWMN